MELKSIWDGWKKQCYHIRSNRSGEHCALGWLDYAETYSAVTLGRVAAAIRQQHPELKQLMLDKGFADFWSVDGAVIAQANNLLKFTPDDFRRIDIETQIEAAVKPLVESAPESVEQGVL